MEEEYSRETIWKSYDGSEKPIKDLEDSHILNLIDYTARRLEKEVAYLESLDPNDEDELDLYEIRKEQRQERVDRAKAIHQIIQEEAEMRNLDRSLVANGKRLPFKKDGKWMIWKEGDRLPTEVPQSIDFIKPLPEGDTYPCRRN